MAHLKGGKMIVKCSTEFPGDSDKRTENYHTKQNLLEWLQSLPDDVRIDGNLVIEVEWTEIR